MTTTYWKLSALAFINLLLIYQVNGLSCYICQWEEGKAEFFGARKSFPQVKGCKTGELIEPRFCPEDEESQCLNIHFTATRDYDGGQVTTKVWRRYCGGRDLPYETCVGELPKHIIVDPNYTLSDVRACYCGDHECNLARDSRPAGVIVCVILLLFPLIVSCYDFEQ